MEDRKAPGHGTIVLEFGSDLDQGFPLLNDNCCFVLGIAFFNRDRDLIPNPVGLFAESENLLKQHSSGRDKCF